MYLILFVHWVYIPATRRESCNMKKAPSLNIHFMFMFLGFGALQLGNCEILDILDILFPIKYGRDFTGKVSWSQCSKFDCTTANIFSITSVLGVYWAEAFKNIDHAEGLIHFWYVWLKRAYGQQANFLRSSQNWQTIALKYCFLPADWQEFLSGIWYHIFFVYLYIHILPTISYKSQTSMSNKISLFQSHLKFLTSPSPRVSWWPLNICQECDSKETCSQSSEFFGLRVPTEYCDSVVKEPFSVSSNELNKWL